MKFMYFSIKYRHSDILLKKHLLHLSCLFCCNHTCYCINTMSVTSASRYITSASRYHPRYQSRSSMYIRGLIQRYFAELADAVPIVVLCCKSSRSWKEYNKAGTCWQVLHTPCPEFCLRHMPMQYTKTQSISA